MRIQFFQGRYSRLLVSEMIAEFPTWIEIVDGQSFSRCSFSFFDNGVEIGIPEETIEADVQAVIASHNPDALDPDVTLKNQVEAERSSGVLLLNVLLSYLAKPRIDRTPLDREQALEAVITVVLFIARRTVRINEV